MNSSTTGTVTSFNKRIFAIRKEINQIFNNNSDNNNNNTYTTNNNNNTNISTLNYQHLLSTITTTTNKNNKNNRIRTRTASPTKRDINILEKAIANLSTLKNTLKNIEHEQQQLDINTNNNNNNVRESYSYDSHLQSYKYNNQYPNYTKNSITYTADDERDIVPLNKYEEYYDHLQIQLQQQQQQQHRQGRQRRRRLSSERRRGLSASQQKQKDDIMDRLRSTSRGRLLKVSSSGGGNNEIEIRLLQQQQQQLEQEQEEQDHHQQEIVKDQQKTLVDHFHKLRSRSRSRRQRKEQNKDQQYYYNDNEQRQPSDDDFMEQQQQQQYQKTRTPSPIRHERQQQRSLSRKRTPSPIRQQRKQQSHSHIDDEYAAANSYQEYSLNNNDSWFTNTRRDVEDATYKIHQVTHGIRQEPEEEQVHQVDEQQQQRERERQREQREQQRHHHSSFEQRETEHIHNRQQNLLIEKPNRLPRPISSSTLVHPLQKVILVDLFSDTVETVITATDTIAKYCSTIDTDNNNYHSNSTNSSLVISDIGGQYILLSIIKKFYNVIEIQINCCIAIHYLSVSKYVREQLNAIDTIETIIKVMKNYSSNTTNTNNNNKLQQYTIGIINSLTWKNELNTTKIGSTGALKYIISIMKTFTTNTIIQQFGTLIIVNMIRWDKFRSIVISNGGREVLTKVIMDYTESQSLKRLSLSTSASTSFSLLEPNKKKQQHPTTTTTPPTTKTTDKKQLQQQQGPTIPMIDFDNKIYKKARKAIRRIL